MNVKELHAAAVSSNNCGIKELQRGNIRLAHELFAKSLRMMTEATSKSRSSPISSPTTLKWCEMSTKLERSLLDRNVSLPFIHTRGIMILMEKEESCCCSTPPRVTPLQKVIMAPKSVSPRHAESTKPEKKTIFSGVSFSGPNEAESIAMLYNVGLSFHLLGLATLRSNLVLEKAVRFYKIAAALVTKTSQLQRKKHRMMIELEMAMISNMGSIFFEFARYKNSDLCFRLLGKRLSAFRENSMEMDRTIFYGLIANSRIKEPTFAAAA